jgi:hypothetical protein
MSSLVLTGDTSGQVTLAAPAVAGSNTITLAAQTGTLNVAGPAFSAYASGSQTIATSTYTKVQFQTKEFDTNSNYDNATNYRFTPTVAGYYQIGANIQFTSTVTGIQLILYKNGSSFKTLYGYGGGTGTNAGSSCLVNANGSSDYFEIYAYQASGATQTVTATATATYFQACLVRGA